MRRLAVITLLISLCGTTAAFAASAPKPKPKPKVVLKLGGTWTGSYSGAYSGTFTIKWTQKSNGALTGTIALSNPKGSYGISGHVRGSAISFGAVDAGATYTGSATLLKMSGSYKTAIGGGSWSAHKLLTVQKLK